MKLIEWIGNRLTSDDDVDNDEAAIIYLWLYSVNISLTFINIFSPSSPCDMTIPISISPDGRYVCNGTEPKRNNGKGEREDNNEDRWLNNVWRTWWEAADGMIEDKIEWDDRSKDKR